VIATDVINFKMIASFSIEYLQILGEEGGLVQPLPAGASSVELINLYKTMLMLRMFDQKAVYLQRIGKIGTYPSSLGQEAISAGIALGLQKEDVFFPSYRDQGILMQRGLTVARCFAWWAGDERGNVMPGYDDFPPCVPVSTQCLHGAGVAYAIKYRRESRAALVCLGDGATSKGDFYEAVNLAGVWDLPIVFVINNNQWAISVPLSQQTRCETLAQKAIAGGIKGVQVDGNDPIAVKYAVEQALENARRNYQPCVIEALTYRLFDHTTADDSKRYRPAKEVEAAWKREPLKRFEMFLLQNGHLIEQERDKIYDESRNTIEDGMREFFLMEKQPDCAMMEYLYAAVPEPFLDQYHQLKKEKK
jgi:2-oxoisovalerate dehydrogenase E1 component alpha subunit